MFGWRVFKHFEALATVLGPRVADDAINSALRAIGVVNDGAKDEFEAMQLSAHQDTGDWLP